MGTRGDRGDIDSDGGDVTGGDGKASSGTVGEVGHGDSAPGGGDSGDGHGGSACCVLYGFASVTPPTSRSLMTDIWPLPTSLGLQLTGLLIWILDEGMLWSGTYLSNGREDGSGS